MARLRRPVSRRRRDRPRDRFLAVGGLRLHAREWGDPAAAPVLCLHGLAGNAWEWDPIARRLARRGFRVVALDQRGHGASDRAADYAAGALVRDVAAAAPALGLDRAALVGHSMGGVVGYLLAARHPAWLARLVVVDIGPDLGSRPIAAELAAWLPAAAAAAYADPEEPVADWLAWNPRAREPELRHFVLHNLVGGRDGRFRWRFDAARLGGFIERLPDEAAQWEALRAVACPALVVRGAESSVLTAATAARMARELRDADVGEIRGAGHDLTVEQPEALAEALEGFLGEP